MKAAQIKNYSKEINTTLSDIPKPQISDSEVLIQVKAAAVNPVELLILTGSVELIQDYPMPLTLGNECSGIVEQDAVAKMPEGYDFNTAAAIPLTGLMAYQAIVEELEAKPGQTILIPGGSGSFGQMAVPIAKALGLRVIVIGNARAKEQFLAMGVDRYLDYKAENYWEILSDIDHVIDTLGPDEFEHELVVLKKGGSKLDKAAQKQGKEYRFVFVRSNGAHLQKITEIVEKQQVKPAVDSRVFSLDQANEALQLVAKGQLNGKVMIQL